jgi:iron complex transport system substrate-binding protein
MRGRPALALSLLLAGCDARAPAAPHRVARPLRVMSMNQCTDQLVLALLPPGRIASVSWLARDPGGSLMAGAAQRVRVNHGRAEEVLAQRPDLVVAGTYTTPALRGMLRRIGYPLIEVDDAETFDAVRQVTRQVAAAVGEQARGEALIAAMDRKLADLARHPGPAIRVAAWDRSGFAAGKGTLYGAVLAAAGAVDVAERTGARRPDVEDLLRADPALLVQGSDASAPSLGDDVARQRVVRRYWGGRTLTIPQASYSCGTPMVADAAIRLRAELRRAAGRAGPALPFQVAAR